MLSSNTSAVSGDANYIEDVFSTYLYTGNGSTQTLTNGIDLAGKGGMVWLKVRSGTTGDHEVFDTLRGATNWLIPNATNAQITDANTLTAFNTNGFSIGNYSEINGSGNGMVSWTFRKQPKFFDVVTYTGDGGTNRAVAHSLGSVPGCIMVKATSTANNWSVYHRSLTANQYSLVLNSTAAENYTNEFPTAPDSTSFYVRSGNNSNGVTYVAYIFAHNAGGFGLTGTDNVITCGSYTGTGAAGNAINLGFEPQWVLIKNSTAGSYPNWFTFDNMRGMTVGNGDPYLYANTAGAEAGGAAQYLDPTATGFNMMASNVINESGQTYIYIAIRRGPMKVPTDATKVFAPVTYTGTGSQTSISSVGFSPDLFMSNERVANSGYRPWFDKLRGSPRFLSPNGTGAEVTGDTDVFKTFDQNGVTLGTDVANNGTNKSGYAYIDYFVKRAPSFFDEVCYTGLGATPQNLTHNLGIAPELIIVRARSDTRSWGVYHKDVGAGYYLLLDSTATPTANVNAWNNTSPTSSVFSVGNSNLTNNNISGGQNVAYLFATCAGVSKVGSYTGNGSSQTIACGFAAGARFVMIKRTDSTGNWYMWDTARGIVSGNDPYIKINEFYTAEVTTDDTIDPDSSGFIVNQLSATNVNVNAATYIFLAIA